MAEEIPRRSLVGAIGALLSAGCLGSPADSGSNDPGGGNGTDDPVADENATDTAPERCELVTRSGWGRGETVETTVTETGDGVQPTCASVAPDRALEATLSRSDVAQHASPPQWIQGILVDRGDERFVEVRVRAERSSELSGDGSFVVCPPESHSFDELIGVVPEEVVVEQQEEAAAETSEPNRTCSLRVRLKQVRQHLD